MTWWVHYRWPPRQITWLAKRFYSTLCRSILSPFTSSPYPARRSSPACSTWQILITAWASCLFPAWLKLSASSSGPVPVIQQDQLNHHYQDTYEDEAGTEDPLAIGASAQARKVSAVKCNGENPQKGDNPRFTPETTPSPLSHSIPSAVLANFLIWPGVETC